MAWLARADFANAIDRLRLAHLSDESLALVAVAAVRIDLDDTAVATLYLLHCAL